MRTMWKEDLGDPRLYEDEAIREQAARLHVHLNNLAVRLESFDTISRKTRIRIISISNLAQDIEDLAEALSNENPL